MYKRVFAALAAFAILGASMTMPQANSADLDLPAAVQNVPESSTVTRIGVVSEIVDADNVTVKLSGSNVLVQASFLFPQYEPVLGDNVAVLKQDAQWLVLGTLSGPINSAIANPSFEEGTLGGVPTGWSITPISTVGGTPTFTKVSAGNTGVAGLFQADFGVDSVAAGFSSADVFSPAVPTVEGTSWTAAYYIVQAFIDNANATFAPGGLLSDIEIFVEFLDSNAALLSSTSMNYFGANLDVPPVKLYRRPAPGVSAAVAPPATAFVRLRLRGTFQMSANSFTSFFLDYMILRRVQ